MKTFFKYLVKNKLYSFVTLFGFAVSLMFVLLLSVYIKQELSVDQFHANKDRIYRLSHENGSYFGPLSGDFIKNFVPEVESYTRIYEDKGNAKFDGKSPVRMEYLLADSSFFTMFSFNLKQGNPHQVLASKNSAVLSETFVRRMFGNENPVGKSFLLNGKRFIISGVTEDLADNTHFKKSDAILNFPVIADLWGDTEMLTNNNNSSFGLYFLAKKGANLPAKAPAILSEFQKSYWIYAKGFAKTLRFEPLSEVYFSKGNGIAIRQNNRNTVLVFGAVALLILIISIINYINLTVAQSGFRSKETAIKKLMGSSKIALLWQHIIESVILSLVSGLIGIILAFLAESFFNGQMDCNLNLSKQFSFLFIISILGMIGATGFISGIIPALVVNKFNPIDIVKGNFTRKTKSSYSKVLIAFQYTVAIVLLISTWTIVKQSFFMQNYDTGFDKENLFWMDNTVSANQQSAFRDLLKTIPGVEEVTYCNGGTPLDPGNNRSFNLKGNPISLQEFTVDSLYLKVMKLKVKPTTAAYSKDGVWLNQAAVKALELGDNPLFFNIEDQNLPILGVVEDFNFRSLYTQIGPLMIRQLNSKASSFRITVKLKGINPIETVKQIRSAQASFTGGIPMDSGFFDDTINQWYAKEVKRSKLIGAFTLLAIIISSMGIFAMSLYYIQQKIKEIGIRKVNGATVSEVIEMLNKDFVKWVIIAFFVATPIAYYVMHKWLENFAYKTSLNWWIFALAGVLALGIALLTVSWQSWRAATRNPVEALRYE